MARIRAYRQQAESDRESLVMAHLGLVKRVAVHLKPRLPPYMELDELVQVGVVGLLEAARQYSADQGVFEHFALARVRGAIIDEVRRMSSLPRSAVAILKQHGGAAHALATTLGRPPTHAEIAAHLGVDAEQYAQDRAAAQRFETVAIDEVSDEVLSLPVDDQDRPDRRLEFVQSIESLTSAIDALPERERMVMSLYYVDELNLREIAAVLGVTESRVSQILSGIVKRLRREVRGDDDR